mmetsp:Transcript_81594/g.219284  ORF Transcript_81594/g.219284 Transcript_81594/m.219284 type:complete len:93 (-) Transcript_81594:7-285(-)
MIEAPDPDARLTLWFTQFHLFGEGHVSVFSGTEAEKLMHRHLLDLAQATRAYTGLRHPWGPVQVGSNVALVALLSEVTDQSVDFVLHWKSEK